MLHLRSRFCRLEMAFRDPAMADWPSAVKVVPLQPKKNHFLNNRPGKGCCGDGSVMKGMDRHI